MSESQAFYLLSVLCDRLLPGYYSMTMYGTLLDQKVFESLVEKTMPILWDHLARSDVQLSVVSLPWFLSLYINSMPLVFAFRVLDLFFVEGPRVLFQIGLAILRINGEELLDASDDGSFISILKSYFSRLEESAHPTSENEKMRAITKFQELLVVALQEFSGITQNSISEQRTRHKDAVLQNIESFAKRTSLRNLGPDSKKLSLPDLNFLYDRFYEVLYERQQRAEVVQQQADRRAKASRFKATEVVLGVSGNTTVEMGRVGLGPSPTQMNYDAFREFLAGITKWAIADSTDFTHNNAYANGQADSWRKGNQSTSEWGAGHLEPADHDFMQRLFGKWDVDQNGELSLQNVVSGMSNIKGSQDIMATIEYFFSLYDDEKTGKVDREGILKMSEGLLFLSRRGFGPPNVSPIRGRRSTQSSFADLAEESTKDGGDEKFLSGVSAFIRRCFEYADPDNVTQVDVTTSDQAVDSATADMGSFSIGDDDDDDEDDLMHFDDKPTNTATTTPKPPLLRTQSIPPASSGPTTPKPNDKSSANAALDPSKPLHITLPTFRMLILADETLEEFFDSAFPSSFYLSSTPNTAVPRMSISSNLTTFSNLPRQHTQSPVPASAAGGGVPPGNKGLRGMLDNIVTDGMRVAAEVKRRMDEAQREMERQAAAGGVTHRDEEEEDDEMEMGSGPGNAETRSVREQDRDLLEGAEAEAIDASDAGLGRSSLLDAPIAEGRMEGRGARQSEESQASGSNKFVEFER